MAMTPQEKVEQAHKLMESARLLYLNGKTEAAEELKEKAEQLFAEAEEEAE